MALELTPRRQGRRALARDYWFAVALTLLWCGTAGADAATDWNKFAVTLVTGAGRSNQEVTAAATYMHIAIYDAVVAIEGGHAPFAVRVRDVPPGASPVAAAAAAAHVILGTLYQSIQMQI